MISEGYSILILETGEEIEVKMDKLTRCFKEAELAMDKLVADHNSKAEAIMREAISRKIGHNDFSLKDVAHLLEVKSDEQENILLVEGVPVLRFYYTQMEVDVNSTQFKVNQEFKFEYLIKNKGE